MNGLTYDDLVSSALVICLYGVSTGISVVLSYLGAKSAARAAPRLGASVCGLMTWVWGCMKMPGAYIVESGARRASETFVKEALEFFNLGYLYKGAVDGAALSGWEKLKRTMRGERFIGIGWFMLWTLHVLVDLGTRVASAFAFLYLLKKLILLAKQFYLKWTGQETAKEAKLDFIHYFYDIMFIVATFLCGLFGIFVSAKGAMGLFKDLLTFKTVYGTLKTAVSRLMNWCKELTDDDNIDIQTATKLAKDGNKKWMARLDEWSKLTKQEQREQYAAFFGKRSEKGKEREMPIIDESSSSDEPVDVSGDGVVQSGKKLDGESYGIALYVAVGLAILILPLAGLTYYILVVRKRTQVPEPEEPQAAPGDSKGSKSEAPAAPADPVAQVPQPAPKKRQNKRREPEASKRATMNLAIVYQEKPGDPKSGHITEIYDAKVSKNGKYVTIVLPGTEELLGHVPEGKGKNKRGRNRKRTNVTRAAMEYEKLKETVDYVREAFLRGDLSYDDYQNHLDEIFHLYDTERGADLLEDLDDYMDDWDQDYEDERRQRLEEETDAFLDQYLAAGGESKGEHPTDFLTFSEAKFPKVQNPGDRVVVKSTKGGITVTKKIEMNEPSKVAVPIVPEPEAKSEQERARDGGVDFTPVETPTYAGVAYMDGGMKGHTTRMTDFFLSCSHVPVDTTNVAGSQLKVTTIEDKPDCDIKSLRVEKGSKWIPAKAMPMAPYKPGTSVSVIQNITEVDDPKIADYRLKNPGVTWVKSSSHAVVPDVAKSADPVIQKLIDSIKDDITMKGCTVMFHDCDTGFGSSGAPIIQMQNGKDYIIGMHYGRLASGRNYGIMFSGPLALGGSKIPPAAAATAGPQ